jgi:hypothetical protein
LLSILDANNSTFVFTGNLLTYLFPDQTGSRQVFAVDLNKSFTPFQLMQSDVNKTLSLQEQLRRERMRLFTQGISSYEWAKPTLSVDNLSKMLIPLNGSVFMFDDNVGVEEEKYRIVYDSQTLGEAVDPHISPNGKLIAFVINDDLYVQSVDSEVPVRLTVNGANKGVTCGLADFIAQEEMHRYHHYLHSSFIVAVFTSVVQISRLLVVSGQLPAGVLRGRRDGRAGVQDPAPGTITNTTSLTSHSSQNHSGQVGPHARRGAPLPLRRGREPLGQTRRGGRAVLRHRAQRIPAAAQVDGPY